MERTPLRSRKDETWLACAPKSCCYTSLIVPTGGDVWRIARALDAPPLSFLMYFESPVARRDAFALDRSARRFRIALAKRASEVEGRPGACAFLLRTRGQHHRCGLGDLRPGVCQCFPCEAVSGLVCIAPDVECACRRWTLGDVDVTDEMPRIRAREEDAALYCDVVARWNHEVMHGDEAPVDFARYCDFLLEAYDAMQSARTRAGQGA